MASAPRLSYPPTIYGRCFRVITDAFAASPLLGRLPLRTLVIWDGSEQSPAAPPSIEMAPWIRISPEAGPAGWATVGQHSVVESIRVETLVAGTDALNALGLWGLIAGGSIDPATTPPTPLPSVLFPGDRSLYTALQAYGCRSYRVSRPDLGEYRAADGVGIAGSGVIDLELYVRTDP
jgi:hypothetical protein